MTQAELSYQPARGPDGQLLDASEIAWYNDPDDPHPIEPMPIVQEGNVIIFIRVQWRLNFLSDQVGQRSRPAHSGAGARLAEAITAEKLDENGTSCCRFTLPRDAKASTKRKRPITDALRDNIIQVDTDVEDKDFTMSVSEGGTDDESRDLDSDDIDIGNFEVWPAPFMIRFKTNMYSIYSR